MSDTKRERDLHDDPRLTAFALGELEGEERAEVARLVADDPEARAFVDEVRELATDLEAGLAPDAAQEVGLTALQRERVTRAAAPGTRHWSGRVAAWGGLAVAGVAAAALAVVALQGDLGAPPETSMTAATAAPPATRPMPGSARAFDGRARAYKRDFDVEQAQGAVVDPGHVELGFGAPEEEAEFEPVLDLTDGLAELPSSVPEEPANREGYDGIHENPFVPARVDALSTFSIDVDTASYSNVRRFLRDGQDVPPDAVRIEELVNYFPYDYAPPASGGRPFAVHVDVAAAPWAPQHRLVRIGLKARDLALDGLGQRKRSNLVFLLDVSGSMDDERKLPLVKRAMALLVEQLGEGDRVSIVVYAGAEGLALEPTPGDAREAILQAIERLDAGGSTNGGAGIELAYRVAAENFVPGGLNRVILCTDGDFNVGVSSDGALERLIEQKAKTGVFLTVLGFGAGNWQDAKMEKLSNRGNGNFAYIDSVLEARKVLVEELGGTLDAVAKDVKIQVEFNPERVQAARLIGYENRVLAHQDFLDDAKDAGEIGAGHTVTALYEVVPVGVPFDAPEVPPSRYQGESPPRANSDELLIVRLRYKQPDGAESTGFEVPVTDGGANFFQAPSDTRFAAAVAAFGMVLRGSEHVGATTLDDVRSWALEALGEDRGGYREGFLELVELARRR